MQSDGTFLGELQGVVDQIGEDLSNARGIALDEARAGCPDVEPAGKALLRSARLQALRDVLHQIVQIERGDIELEFSGIQLREIENVVQDSQQASRRLLQSAELFFLSTV